MWGPCALEVDAENDPRFYAVQASANVQVSPPQIRLQWPADGKATGYKVSRKELGAASWGGESPLPGTATGYVDSSVAAGVAYEYQISKTTSAGYAGFGYVCAGIRAPLIEDRGKLVLVVDGLYAAELANELSQLHQNLTGDGWTVLRHDVSRTDSPANIKNIIQADYAADPAGVKAVFLFGHIPVPYSGNLNPDGHPDHRGAWPTDAYYGDMDGSWTDHSVSNTSAQRQANWNVPGDGKFDQSELPSEVELEVGRVDLSNMTCFSNKTPARYEKDLLRQYLKKDHAFRHGRLLVQRRGIICDNFGEKSGEAFAASGWRNFAAFFGADNITAVPGWNYFSTVGSQSYLWSYGCGGGSYYTCDGIGTSDDFARTDVQSVFTMFLGSYFGDWDNESNFLRAPLGSTSCTLAAAWAGRPHWFFHHMALGHTIGYSARLSQNNRSGGLYSAQNYSTRGIHVSLLGDPTLRLHPVIPPSSLNGSPSPAGMALTWTASTDSDLEGYYVYRSGDKAGPYQRISGDTPITQTSYVDPQGGANTFTYMVRAIKLERSGSGTYLNPSQGVFFGPDSGTSWGHPGSGSTSLLPSAPSGLAASILSASHIALRWTDTARDELGFKIERKAGSDGVFATIANLGPNETSFTDAGLASGTAYSYRVLNYNAVGNSPYSNEAQAMTPAVPEVPAGAVFLAADSATLGDWVGVYGREGYHIVGANVRYPAYAAVEPQGAADWTWDWLTAENRALLTESGLDRIAAAWYSTGSFAVDLHLRDGQTHQVALYCLDWDTGARRQTVEIADAASGRILNSQVISDFHRGRYLVWNLTGHVIIRVTRNAGLNAAVSGLFFDPAPPTPELAAPPTIDPPGGFFLEPTLVTLSTATPDGVIRYTLDGTEPSAASREYHGPFLVSASALISAKTFKSGLGESPVTTASFRLNSISTGRAQALFVRADAATQGDWLGVYGSEGYCMAGLPDAAPSYASIQAAGAQSYLWTDTSTDRRALLKGQASDRVAACWYSDPAFGLEVDFADGNTHRLALYCLDWDRRGRSQVVDVLDAESGALITSQTLAGFEEGKYLVWDIKGRVRIRFTRIGGNNAVVMGLFFSRAAVQLGDEDSGSLTVRRAAAPASGMPLRITGQVGERFVIQASSDLANWSVMRQITLPSRTFDFADPDAALYGTRFYRALPATVEPGGAEAR